MNINPLSSLKYCIRNITKLAPLVTVIALSILAATITAAIASSASVDYRENLNFYKNYYILQVKRDKNAENTIN